MKDMQVILLTNTNQTNSPFMEVKAGCGLCLVRNVMRCEGPLAAQNAPLPGDHACAPESPCSRIPTLPMIVEMHHSHHSGRVQIDVHHIGKVQLKGLSTALDVVHMSSKRLSQRKFISPSLSSKASFTGAGRGHVCSVLPPLGLGKGTSPSHGSKAEEVASVLIARDRRRLSQL